MHEISAAQKQFVLVLTLTVDAASLVLSQCSSFILYNLQARFHLAASRRARDALTCAEVSAET